MLSNPSEPYRWTVTAGSRRQKKTSAFPQKKKKRYAWTLCLSHRGLKPLCILAHLPLKADWPPRWASERYVDHPQCPPTFEQCVLFYKKLQRHINLLNITIIKNALNHFWHKSPSHLFISESLTLAGMLSNRFLNSDTERWIKITQVQLLDKKKSQVKLDLISFNVSSSRGESYRGVQTLYDTLWILFTVTKHILKCLRVESAMCSSVMARLSEWEQCVWRCWDAGG